jgi:hypothetical protein
MRTTLALLALSLASCTSSPPDVADATPKIDKQKLDILFVVDNSGSMADKQLLLSQTIMKPGCPIENLQQVPENLQQPPPSTRNDLEQECGFAQLLAADDRDFHIGVITTDVDACDNAVPVVEGGDAWGFHPQRGCLQPVPSTGQKLITRDDSDVATHFEELITSLGTYGSPFERGLDAAEIFLTHDSWVSDGCDGDRDQFLRDDAQLLVVFVSDEDDCSHLNSSTFPDETLTKCGADDSLVTQHDPGQCYSNASALNPVSRYASLLKSLKPDPSAVSVAVIGGAVTNGNQLVASGCILVDGQYGPVTSSQCFASGGLENFTAAGQPCDPDSPQLNGEQCCLGDPAARYFELQGQLTFTGGSICSPAFVQPLMTATTPAG